MTESDGYRLDVDAGDVDADRFEALVAGARALNDTDTARAVALLEEAEDLWRGPAFGQLAARRWSRRPADLVSWGDPTDLAEQDPLHFPATRGSRRS